MQKVTLKQIEQAIRNFLERLSHNFPKILKDVARKALEITLQAEKLLRSGLALVAVKLMPELEPYRQAILKILEGLEKAFHAVDEAFQGGVLMSAQAQITAALDGNRFRYNRYYLAAQVAFSERPEAQTELTA